MKILFFIISLVIAVSAFAGLPGNDPVVASARARFQLGVVPTPEFMTSAFFDCYQMRAIHGDDTKEKYGSLIYFEVQGGFYILKTVNDRMYANNTMLANTAAEILGNARTFDTDFGGPSAIALRVYNSEYLMVEISNYLTADKKRLAPIAAVNGTALSYMSCNRVK
jgi:hypothetical protein